MSAAASCRSVTESRILSVVRSKNASRCRILRTAFGADALSIFAIQIFDLGCNRLTPELRDVFHEITAALLGAYEPFRDQLVVCRCDRCNADIEMLGKVAFGRQLRPAGDSAARDVLANGLV